MPTINFETKPYKIGAWTVLPLPQSASSKLPSRGQVMVKGTINGVPLHTALEPDGDGGHWLNIDKNMPAKAGKTAKLQIEATKIWPEPFIPKDVKKGIVDNPKVRDQWKKITPMARWEWLRWIDSTANADTRKKRIDVSVDKLAKGMRRPCCFNRSMCCVPAVSKSGVLIGPK